MRLRLPLLSLAALALGSAAPALAHPDHDGPPPGAPDAEGRFYGDAMPGMPPMFDDDPGIDGYPMPMHGPMGSPRAQREHWEHMRGEWLDRCRAQQDGWRSGRRDDGLGGALIGGVAGGVLGNRIAGRGDRVLGTVIGAAAGAAVGAAIDQAEDRGPRRDYRGDYCEQYLDYYTQGGGWGYQGYGYGYAQPMMMVPVMMVPAQGMAMGAQHGRVCKETVVTEEWVTVREPRRVRYIPVRDKRVRMVPDKRVPMK